MIVCLLVLPIINAATDTQNVDDTFQINSVVSYAKPCFYNGSYCSSTTVCNFTIFKPDNTKLIDNFKSTNNITSYNISFYVDTIGIYTANQVCCDGSLCGSETYYFEVTGSGLNNVTYFFIIILSIAMILIFLGFSIKDGWITILGCIGLFFVGLYILLNGIDIMRNLTVTRSFALIIIGVASYISLRSGYEMLDL